jgi:hypothetical protein
MPMVESSGRRPDARADREKRLAEALRANLKRRKDSERRKSAAAASSDVSVERNSRGSAGAASSDER